MSSTHGFPSASVSWPGSIELSTGQGLRSRIRKNVCCKLMTSISHFLEEPALYSWASTGVARNERQGAANKRVIEPP